MRRIAFELKPDYEFRGANIKRMTAGPNRWNEMQPRDFGPEEDYAIIDGNVYMPVSRAGLQWAYAKFPRDTPRCGTGFIIDSGLEIIQIAARRDGLLSRDDYQMAMEFDSAARQWEDV